jgi:tetratricopeptide (TPR) repeat protein
MACRAWIARVCMVGLCSVSIATICAPVRALADPMETPSLATLMTLAHQAETAGRSATALALYRQAAESHPYVTAPLTAMGELANRAGAPERAVEILGDALLIDEYDVPARAALAEALVDLDRQREALALYDALLREDPANSVASAGKSAALARLAEGPTSEVLAGRTTSARPQPIALITPH